MGTNKLMVPINQFFNQVIHATMLLMFVFIHVGAGGDHHISPIENLDNTISRLYSYLSGSEGEPEPNHPQRR